MSSSTSQTKRPRVLCIAGSPRRRGNTDLLCDVFDDAVRDAGGEPVRLVASQVGSGPCTGCNACSSTGACVVRDAMDEVYPLLDAADAIAVVTPVYFASVPSALKALVDRCQPYWARRYVLHEPPVVQRRPGAIVVVGGGGDPFGSACAVTPLRSALNVLQVTCEEPIELTDIDSPGDVMRHPHAVERVRAVATRLVDLSRP